MSQVNALYTKALSASELTQKLLAVAPAAFPNENVQLTVQTNIQGLGLSLVLPANDASNNASVREFLARVKDRGHILTPHGLIHLHNNGAYQIAYSTDDGVIGRITIQMQNDAARAIAALDAVEKQFRVTSYVDLVRASSPVVDQSAIAMRERSVADLQETMEKLADFQAELSQREIKSRQTLEEAQQKSYQERVDALDKEYRDRQAALDKRKADDEAAAAKRDKEHAERVAQFETREAKYIRRDLLKQIQTVLEAAEKTALSGPTGKKRWWIHGFVWLLMAASGTLAGCMAYRIFSAQQADWHVLGPLSAGFVTFVVTTVYYLKWNDRWFREHADSEFAAKRYKSDILRASWVAELVSERTKEGPGELSPDLIAAYTRNLFRDVGSSRVSEHPLDDLTALVKRARRIDIGKGVFSLRGDAPESK